MPSSTAPLQSLSLASQISRLGPICQAQVLHTPLTQVRCPLRHTPTSGQGRIVPSPQFLGMQLVSRHVSLPPQALMVCQPRQPAIDTQRCSRSESQRSSPSAQGAGSQATEASIATPASAPELVWVPESPREGVPPGGRLVRDSEQAARITTNTGRIRARIAQQHSGGEARLSIVRARRADLAESVVQRSAVFVVAGACLRWCSRARKTRKLDVRTATSSPARASSSQQVPAWTSRSKPGISAAQRTGQSQGRTGPGPRLGALTPRRERWPREEIAAVFG